MSKGEETRQQIVAQAAVLFNQRGYEGCSMGDVMEATGLEKGGLYRHFKCKEDLAAEAFRYSVALSTRLRMPSAREGWTPMERLRLMIAHFVAAPSAVPGGCPLLNTAIDSDDGNERLRGLAREAFAGWRRRIVRLVRVGQSSGEIAPDADATWLANTIISTLEGALMLSRLERKKEPLLGAQRALEMILDAVSAR